MSGAHTPGPWFGPLFDSPFPHQAGMAVTGKLKGKNGYRLRVEVSGDAIVANARLIAASPDMLEALENLVNSFEKHRPKEYWDAARAAIAKAKGAAS